MTVTWNNSEYERAPSLLPLGEREAAPTTDSGPPGKKHKIRDLLVLVLQPDTIPLALAACRLERIDGCT